jgi:hypothetical protein
MIKNGDTLPYKEVEGVHNGERVFLGECFTFEKVNNHIINQSDDYCKRQGFWILITDKGSYDVGWYKDGKRKGVWKFYDKNHNLLSEVRKVSIADDTYVIKKVVYKDGVPTVVIDKKFLGLYLDYFFIWVSIIFAAFFIRIFVNSKIYNVENGTDYSPIFPLGSGSYRKTIGHGIQCMYSFWFSNYKPENKNLVKVSNALSLIFLVVFFGLIIGLAILGELN